MVHPRRRVAQPELIERHRRDPPRLIVVEHRLHDFAHRRFRSFGHVRPQRGHHAIPPLHALQVALAVARLVRDPIGAGTGGGQIHQPTDTLGTERAGGDVRRGAARAKVRAKTTRDERPREDDEEEFQGGTRGGGRRRRRRERRTGDDADEKGRRQRRSGGDDRECGGVEGGEEDKGEATEDRTRGACASRRRGSGWRGEIVRRGAGRGDVTCCRYVPSDGWTSRVGSLEGEGGEERARARTEREEGGDVERGGSRRPEHEPERARRFEVRGRR